MTVLSISTVVLTLWPIIYGISLPGPCPERSSTNISELTQFDGRILAIKPYADKNTESNIFGKMAMDLMNCKSIQFRNGFEELMVLNKYSPEIFVYCDIFSKNYGVYRVYSEIRDSTGQFLETSLRENVYFWTYNDYGILWSCVEKADSNSHDEALILTISEDLFEKGGNMTTLEAIEMLEKAFDESIIKGIIWASVPKDPNKECRNESNFYSNYKYFVTFYIVVFGFVTCVFVACFYVKKKNEVGVIE